MLRSRSQTPDGSTAIAAKDKQQLTTMKMLANHIDLTNDHCADTRFALARETRRTERSENEAGNVERSLKPKLSEQIVQHERLRPHPRLPVLIFAATKGDFSYGEPASP
jgi:hypothetical protein